MPDCQARSLAFQQAIVGVEEKHSICQRRSPPPFSPERAVSFLLLEYVRVELDGAIGGAH
jgi:hypothetical protein